MKLGIAAQYINTRSDIREFIVELSKRHVIVLFLNAGDLGFKKYFSDEVEIRQIKTAIKGSLRNIVMVFLFNLFGRIPKSRQNYFMTEQFKYSNASVKNIKYYLNYILFKLSRFTPKWLSYDRYLKMLAYSQSTGISDIDKFLLFTPIYNDHLLAQLIDEDKKISVYVYSWDHPCKMKCFSKKVDRYFVWNAGLKDDLLELQNIEPEKIEIWGSTQLTYIASYKEMDCKLKENKYPFKYFYFGCATGYKKLVKEEVSFIADIAGILKEFPEYRLLVRPYPFLALWELYDSLKQYENVVFETYDKVSKDKINGLERTIFDKLNTIAHAEAFIHIGTTMGFEAAYFNKPVCMINYVDGKMRHVHDFIHQYQNDKYLCAAHYKNVIKDKVQLREVIAGIASGRDFTAYNETIAGTTPALSMVDYIERNYNSL